MQNKVKIFNSTLPYYNKHMSTSARILDITSELGELSKELLKATNYGTKDFVLTKDFKMEYGDLLYAVLSLANETGIDAEESLNIVIEKYSNRLKVSNSLGSNKN